MRDDTTNPLVAVQDTLGTVNRTDPQPSAYSYSWYLASPVAHILSALSGFVDSLGTVES